MMQPLVNIYKGEEENRAGIFNLLFRFFPSAPFSLRSLHQSRRSIRRREGTNESEDHFVIGGESRPIAGTV